MTERTFHPLTERLADVLAAGLKADLSGEEIVQDILDAIDASGIAWVAPWDATEAMDGDEVIEGWGDFIFAKMRDAYLAEREGEER